MLYYYMIFLNKNRDQDRLENPRIHCCQKGGGIFEVTNLCAVRLAMKDDIKPKRMIFFI